MHWVRFSVGVTDRFRVRVLLQLELGLGLNCWVSVMFWFLFTVRSG